MQPLAATRWLPSPGSPASNSNAAAAQRNVCPAAQLPVAPRGPTRRRLLLEGCCLSAAAVLGLGFRPSPAWGLEGSIGPYGAVSLDRSAGVLEVEVPPGADMVLEGEPFQLQQLRLLAPSEHTFGGRRRLLEAHLVHRSAATGKVAVVAVLIDSGGAEPNRCLDAVLASAAPTGSGMGPATVRLLQRPLAPLALLPPARLYSDAGGDSNRPFAAYNGEGGERWLVFLDTLRVPATQALALIRALAAGGAGLRPPPPTRALPGGELQLFL